MFSAPPLRHLLALGRVAQLPTVWSNCLAGWWLGGGGTPWKLPLLLLGVSLLHNGGMFLNDAFDEDFDRQRRVERPIPGGKVAAGLVWRLGFGQLALGVFVLLLGGKTAAAAALGLTATILLYNFTHTFFTASPWLLGACRFWVYVIAGATGKAGLNGWPIFCGLALAGYAAGLGSLGRWKPVRAAGSPWAWLPLATPVALAMVMNTGSYRPAAICLSLLLAVWTVRWVRPVLGGSEVNAGRIAGNLLAGIVLVDWLAVAPQISHWTALLTFLPLFALTLGWQRFLPPA